MNLLAYQKSEVKKRYPKMGDYHEEATAVTAFNSGFKAAMDLNLPLRFAEWLRLKYRPLAPNKRDWISDKNMIYTTEEIFKEFLETLEI